MDKGRGRFFFFLVLVAVQIGLPLSMVFVRENILSSGKTYLFRTNPADPYDIFKGRYVELSLPDLSWETLSPLTQEDLEGRWESGKDAYALLKKNGDYWAIDDIVFVRPRDGDYLRLSKVSLGRIPNPFDRYYLNQKKAPRVETAFRDEDNASVLISIKKGRGVIKAFYLNDKKAEDFLNAEP